MGLDMDIDAKNIKVFDVNGNSIGTLADSKISVTPLFDDTDFEDLSDNLRKGESAELMLKVDKKLMAKLKFMFFRASVRRRLKKIARFFVRKK